MALAKNTILFWLKPLKTNQFFSLQLKLEAIENLKTEFIEYKKSFFTFLSRFAQNDF
jgi:hypothetical protein